MVHRAGYFIEEMDLDKLKKKRKTARGVVRKLLNKIADAQKAESYDLDPRRLRQCYLEEPARSVIAGILLTDKDYETAVGILKKRFAKPGVIQRAHINEMINLQGVFSEKNSSCFRNLHDQIEIHYRGLEVIDADKNSYSSIIVPILMEKVPEGISKKQEMEANFQKLWDLDSLGIREKDEVHESVVDNILFTGERFRANRVAIVGDIEKAFLNIEIHPEDRDSLRFLWVRNVNDSEADIVTYRFNRVVFGVSSSLFLLNVVLRFHLQTYQDSDPDFLRDMIEWFFVDNLVTSCKDASVALELYQKARERMKEGGFRLRKWKTNDKDLGEQITATERQAGQDSPEKVGDACSYAKET
eukprot:gene21318-biopygen16354